MTHTRQTVRTGLTMSERNEAMAALQTFMLDGQKYALVAGELVPVQDANGKSSGKTKASTAEPSARIPSPVPNGDIRAAFGGPAKYGPGCETDGCGRQTAWDKRRGDWRKRCPSRMLATDPSATAIAKRFKAETVTDATDGNRYVMLPACERSARKTKAERDADKAALKAAQTIGRGKVATLAETIGGLPNGKTTVRVLAATTLGKVLLETDAAERDMLQAVVHTTADGASRFAKLVEAFDWSAYGWKTPAVTR